MPHNDDEIVTISRKVLQEVLHEELVEYNLCLILSDFYDRLGIFLQAFSPVLSRDRLGDLDLLRDDVLRIKAKGGAVI